MTQSLISRRKVLSGGTAMMVLAAHTVTAKSADLEIHVLKDPNCGCCTAWIKLLETDGFIVTTEPSFGTALMQYKLENGIPQDITSCHTARVQGFMIEGHVPVADIRRLLDEQPDAIGLAVPGMPYGSPGMGPATEREAYDVLLIRNNGKSEIFSRYPAA